MNIDLNPYRVQPGSHVRLDKIDPADSSPFKGDKEKSKELVQVLNLELEGLQERLYAEHKHALLVILQGMDTCGKDGTIRTVFDGVNPQGVRVASFKAPTATELEHDYLWRVHQQAPAKGEMVIFNRSHYEDVLVVRVHQLVPEKVWSRRYSHINDFERMLVDEGVTILKFFLHISKHEQKERLLARLDEPDKRWKFNAGDLKERKRWEDYMHAYQDMLGMTSTTWAPWTIIPADRKWYRNLLVASALVETLRQIDPRPRDPYQPHEIETYRKTLEDE